MIAMHAGPHLANTDVSKHIPSRRPPIGRPPIGRTPSNRPWLVWLLALLLPQLLGACANSDYFEPTPLADSRNAMVYLYRPAATNPGKKPLRTSYPEVMVDGQSRGFLKYNQYLPLELAPGKRQFVLTGLTRDARWEPEDRTYTLKLEAGETYFMRFRVEFDVDNMSLGTFTGQYLIYLHPVDREEAIYEIRHTAKGNPS